MAEMRIVIAAVSAGFFAAAGMAAASPMITVSASIAVRGTVSYDGTSLGAYTLISSNPLITDPAVPGPSGDTFPTGDFLAYQGYVFALSQPATVSFETSLLNPYTTYTTLAVNAVQGQSGTIPFAIDYTLPSVATPAIYDSANLAYGDFSTNPIIFNPKFPVTATGGESVDFTRESAYATKYTGAAIIQDPVVAGQIDQMLFSGLVTLTKEDGGWWVSDTFSLALRSATTLITAKSTETGLYTGPIPEPGTYALMILGVGATGAALRRRPLRATTTA